ncbi:MAG TPA: RdgB/HAM1 family non-canonical purine NTP pyrophosphatase [Bacteroidales bacterium]|nr:RdgB/HAM1 family non-canonical purine NTP pyrophosphatase [Bacteroidales bacterium]
METLVFATNNKHKLEEIRAILNGIVEVTGLRDIGFTGEIPEEHQTLEGNAAQKALFIYHRFGMECFADDTGLEIEALNGEPGVYSARYAGENCTFDDNMNLVLEKMKGVKNRNARFRTVIALVEKGNLVYFQGSVNGLITDEKHGKKGFGYDPIFKPEGFDRTFAEMPMHEKNSISHRAIATEALFKYLNGLKK